MTSNLHTAINAAIAKGMTVTVATAYRVVPVKAKHVAAWAKAGHDFFITDSKGMTCMIDGQRKGAPVYVAIGGAKVTAA
jgi:hypothetical protein